MPDTRKTVALVATTPFALRVYIALHVLALSERYRVVLLCNFEGDR
jgi:hypothetical protein